MMRNSVTARAAHSRASYTVKFDPKRSSRLRRDDRTKVQSQDVTPAPECAFPGQWGWTREKFRGEMAVYRGERRSLDRGDRGSSALGFRLTEGLPAPGGHKSRK